MAKSTEKDEKDFQIEQLTATVAEMQKQFSKLLSDAQSEGLPVEPTPMPPTMVCLNGRQWIDPRTKVVPEEYANPLDRSQTLRYMRILQKGEKPRFGQPVYLAKDVPTSWDPPAQPQGSVILDYTGAPIKPEDQEDVETQAEQLAKMEA